jgi:hypothetical protein
VRRHEEGAGGRGIAHGVCVAAGVWRMRLQPTAAAPVGRNRVGGVGGVSDDASVAGFASAAAWRSGILRWSSAARWWCGDDSMKDV